MKNYNKLILLVLTLTIFAGCKSSIGLEIREPPTTQAEVDPPVENPTVENPKDNIDEIVTSDCPEYFVKVPSSASNAFSLPEFCIAKYEMKASLYDDTPVNDGSNNGGAVLNVATHKASSRPSGTPWIRITSAEAKSKCTELGEKYSLITLVQWNAVARNIESVASNWTGNSVGTGILFKGHTDGAISATAVADGYAFGSALLLAADVDSSPFAGTGNSSSSTPEQARVHSLSNGEKVWDMGGNARDLVDLDGLGGSLTYNSNLGQSLFYELSELSTLFDNMVSSNNVVISPDWFTPTSSSYTSANGIGKIFAKSSGLRTGFYVSRGGNFKNDNGRGIFGGDLDAMVNDRSSSGAMRCVYKP